LAIAVFGSGIFLVLAGMQQQNNWVPQWAKKFSPDTLLTSGILISFLGIVFLSGLFVSAFSPDEKNSSAQPPKTVEGSNSEAIPIEIADKFEANKNGEVRIEGKTTPGTQVVVSQGGEVKDSTKADNNGYFRLKLKVDPYSTGEYSISAAKGVDKTEKKIVVIGPAEYSETSISSSEDSGTSPEETDKKTIAAKYAAIYKKRYNELWAKYRELKNKPNDWSLWSAGFNREGRKLQDEIEGAFKSYEGSTEYMNTRMLPGTEFNLWDTLNCKVNGTMPDMCTDQLLKDMDQYMKEAIQGAKEESRK